MSAAAAVLAAGFIFGSFPVYGAAAADPDGRDVQAAETADAGASETSGNSFDDAVDALYAQSGSITDEEILTLSREICSEESALYSGLDRGAAENAAAALSAYEASKADYIRARINVTGNDVQETAEKTFAAAGREETSAAVFEWDLQSAYAKMLIGEGSTVRELIPRYKVTGCSCSDGVLKIDVEEWMTMGYGSAAESGGVSATAFSYSFILSLQKSGEDDSWVPCAVGGTEGNFTWLREETDPELLSQEAPASLYSVQSDLGGQTIAYAQIGANAEWTDHPARAQGGVQEDGHLSFVIDGEAAVIPAAAESPDAGADAQMYAAASGTTAYSPAKAVAYADKYWKNYNRSYKEYRGVDCANFVSQCLYAGGMPKTSDWYPQSIAWINVTAHIRHFKSYGSFVTASNSNVRRGNPVYYDWNGDGTYDHTAICVGTNSSGMPVVDAHTNNVYHAAWSMGSSGRRGTILLRTTASASSASTVEKNTWKTISGKVYYLGSDGKAVKSRFLTIGGKRYYFNASGVRASGFFKVGEKWYYADPSNGALATGWKKLSGNYYYFSKKAYYRLYGGMKKIGNDYYFFNNSGVRQVSFLKVGDKWYYADKETGKFITGWRKIHGEWYYFDKKTMVKTIGWKTIDGHRCYFDSYGILKKGKHG